MRLAFSLEPPGHALAREWARELALPLADHEERLFDDGERKLRPLVTPRDADVSVLCGLHGESAQSPHDKLLRLLMFIAALRDHGAARVTTFVPYLAYARKDRRTKLFDPVGLRYVAQLFEAVGVSRIVVLEAHNLAAFQSAFRCEAVNVPAHDAFAEVANEWIGEGEATVVASPDPGGVKRAQIWREVLEARHEREIGFAMIDKRRSAGVMTSLDLVAGDVDDANVLLLDDLIASGETMRRAAIALKRKGARRVVACAAHGLFTGDAARVLADDHIDHVVVTDSVPPWRVPTADPLRGKLRIASCARLLARAFTT
ncbi:MAG TPA: ribose-phosphate diphosphokinase [Burkholderiaceae bacterium]|nr:ribose-phosphate diphosphokinase [Burkholderiaceae bacterium]